MPELLSCLHLVGGENDTWLYITGSDETKKKHE